MNTDERRCGCYPPPNPLCQQLEREVVTASVLIRVHLWLRTAAEKTKASSKIVLGSGTEAAVLAKRVAPKFDAHKT